MPADCKWWPRPSTDVYIYMQRALPRTARVVLLWGGKPLDLNVAVEFRNIRFPLTGYFKAEGEGAMSCPYGDILAGGGVYWGCRQQKMYTIDETGINLPRGRVAFEKDVDDGFGPEVVLFQDPPDGEYHITVTANPTVPPSERDGFGEELLIGAEEVRVYFADGSSKSVYTSVRASQAGIYWHVGYLRVEQGQMSFVTLNYDQLTKDPLKYKDGWQLSFHLEVFDSKTNDALDGVKYQCFAAGKLANAGDLLSKGNLPQTTFEIENQIYVELAKTGTIYGQAADVELNIALDFPEQEFLIVLSRPGYTDKQVRMTFKGRVFKQEARSVMVPYDHATYVVLDWAPASKKDLDLWLLPCVNTGAWNVEAPASKCQEGEVLQQGAIYWGCSHYTQPPAKADGQPGSLETVIDNLDGSGPETLSLLNMPGGYYDVWVHSYDEVAFEGNEKIEVRLASGDGLTHVSHQSEYLTAPAQTGDGGPHWWHVGYINRTRLGDTGHYLTNFVGVDMLGSPPTSSGCRIPAAPPVFFAANASGGGITLDSGISVSVAPGALPARRSASGPITVSVTQLAVPPMAPPAGAKFGAPLIYLEPSGTEFNGPGVNISMPLSQEEDEKVCSLLAVEICVCVCVSVRLCVPGRAKV